MQINPEQLFSRLDQGIPPLIWVSGDETLLVQECLDNIRQRARDQGYTEREVIDTHAHFNWGTLFESANNLSLFADRKIIDLRLHSTKIDNDARKALQDYAANPGEDNLLLITSHKLEKAALSAKWFKAVESCGLFVQIWPINARQLPGWIAQRLQRHGLSADRDSIDILCQRVEGNLLAAAQEIDKLAVLAGSEGRITAAIVARAVADNARFNVFSLIDAALAGHSAKALSILNHLQSEGEDALKMLFFITKETRTLLRMRGRVQRGENVNGVMQAERVWKNRMDVVGHALRNHTVSSLEQSLLHAVKIDQSVKGLRDDNPWDELADLVLALANTPVSALAGASAV